MQHQGIPQKTKVLQEESESEKGESKKRKIDRILVGDWHAMGAASGDPTKDESTSEISNLPNLHRKVQSALNLFAIFGYIYISNITSPPCFCCDM